MRTYASYRSSLIFLKSALENASSTEDYMRILNKLKEMEGKAPEVLKINIEKIRNQMISVMQNKTTKDELLESIYRFENQMTKWGERNIERINSFGMWVMIIGFIGIGLLTLMSRNVLNKLTKMKRYLKELKEDIEVNVEFDGNDEVSEVGILLKEFARVIKERLRSIEEIKLNLEEEIDKMRKAISVVKELFDKWSEGRFNYEIRCDDSLPLLEDMFRSARRFKETFSKLLFEISLSSREIVDMSKKILEGVRQVADSSAKQETESADAANAMEEMSSTILSAAQNAQKTQEETQNALMLAEESSKKVKEAIRKVNALNEVLKVAAQNIMALGERSEEIGEMAKIITQLADQTNLLALNASIESARAGEYGKGFSVVADEIKQLADSSRNATTKIIEIIEQIKKEAENSARAMEESTKVSDEATILARETSESLDKIMEGAKLMNEVMTQIAIASQEESTAANEVSKKIEAISLLSKENATKIREIMSILMEFSQKVEDLHRKLEGINFEGIKEIKLVE